MAYALPRQIAQIRNEGMRISSKTSNLVTREQRLCVCIESMMVETNECIWCNFPLHLQNESWIHWILSSEGLRYEHLHKEHSIPQCIGNRETSYSLRAYLYNNLSIEMVQKTRNFFSRKLFYCLARAFYHDEKKHQKQYNFPQSCRKVFSIGADRKKKFSWKSGSPWT